MKRIVPLLLLAAAGASAAQLPSFDEVDTNSDGEISVEEAAVVDGLDLAKCDTDGDEYLSREEYAACK